MVPVAGWPYPVKVESADKGAMEDEDRGVKRGVLGDGRPDEVAGRTHRSFRQVFRRVNLCHSLANLQILQDFPSLPQPQPQSRDVARQARQYDKSR